MKQKNTTCIRKILCTQIQNQKNKKMYLSIKLKKKIKQNVF